MADYLVLARKYRSASFQEVVGQEHISTTLANAVKTARIAQAYLFTGTRGVGKTTMARILAKALNCLSSEAPTPDPCNECDACVAIGRGDDIDVIEIDGASNRGIDEIRELRSNALLHPARCRYKVYYIDEVHMLTKDAFNALLKTLEEPPPHVKFIFSTTEAQKIPATVLSRCQRFDFRNIATADIAEHLRTICEKEQVRIDDDAVFRIARAAAGSMRDGISLLDQLNSSAAGQLTEQDVFRVLGAPPDERIAVMLQAIAGGDVAGAMGRLDEVLAEGYPLEGVVSGLADQYRNLMLALTCGTDSKLIELGDAARAGLAELTKGYTVPAAVHAVGVCEGLMRSIRGSSCARALAEAVVVRLAAADKFVDPASLVQRLERLAGSPSPAGTASPAKKKPLTVPADRPQAEPSGEPAEQIEWDAAWLTEHWSQLMSRLDAMGYARVAGSLRPAKPLAAWPGGLRLGFDADHEPIRNHAGGGMADAIAEALAKLAGRDVQCQLVATGQASGRGSAPDVQATRAISSEDRRKVEKDPAVATVMDLFGGQLADIRRDVDLARTAEGEAPAEADTEADGAEAAGDME